MRVRDFVDLSKFLIKRSRGSTGYDQPMKKRDRWLVFGILDHPVNWLWLWLQISSAKIVGIIVLVLIVVHGRQKICSLVSA